MKYKLFISDFDGTLGNTQNVIDDEVIEAIKKYTALGGKFVICSGRMTGAILPICRKYGLSGYVVSFQGACITDIETGEKLLDAGLDVELASMVVKDFATEPDLQTVADVQDVMYCVTDSPYTDFHKPYVPVRKVPDILEAIKALGHSASKIVGVGSPETVARLTAKYSAKYAGKLICNNGADVLLEVINPRYSKGNAVKVLAEKLNVPYDQILTVGDSTNDIELVRGEWHGVAVGDAKEELKAVAKEITVPFNEKPVKYLLEKYCI